MASKASSRVLTDHDDIRRWAEERGAKPAAVRSTESESDIGIIRLDFPGYSGKDSLEEVSWDEWFDQFDDRNLALVVQEETANGKPSNFNKLVSRDSVDESSKSTGRKSTGGKTSRSSAKKTQSRAASTASRREGGTTRARGSQTARAKKSGSRKKAA